MKIIGTGKALPSLSVTNDMLAEFLDTSIIGLAHVQELKREDCSQKTICWV